MPDKRASAGIDNSRVVWRPLSLAHARKKSFGY
jgi:hypothetical protein